MLIIGKIFTLCIFLLFFNKAYSLQLTGDELIKSLNSKLLEFGVVSNPAINKNKKFHICFKDFILEKKYNSWKTVKVSCRSNLNNSFIIRTKVGNKIQKNPSKIIFPTNKKVVAVSESLKAGETLDENNLTLIDKKNKNYGIGIFFLKENVIGRKLKTSLSTGTIIRSRHLTKDWLINKNQIVTIENKLDGIIISADGIAEEPGRLGDRIIVRNINSGKKVYGWIEDEKKIRINTKIN